MPTCRYRLLVFLFSNDWIEIRRSNLGWMNLERESTGVDGDARLLTGWREVRRIEAEVFLSLILRIYGMTDLNLNLCRHASSLMLFTLQFDALSLSVPTSDTMLRALGSDSGITSFHCIDFACMVLLPS